MSKLMFSWRKAKLIGCAIASLTVLVAGFSPLSSAQTIRLITEHYPPYNIDLSLNDPNARKGIGGASTEIVIEMIRRSEYPYSLELLPWKRGYAMAQEEPFVGLFSTTRTKARENIFKWVGPIANNNYVLFKANGSSIQVNSIKDASKYRIGAYRGAAGEALLKEAGLPADIVRSDHLNALKLQRNRIDLWISGNLYGPYLAKQYGVTGMEEAFTMREAQMYVAFNPKTPDSIIKKLNRILDDMRAEGFLDKVYSSYK